MAAVETLKARQVVRRPNEAIDNLGGAADLPAGTSTTWPSTKRWRTLQG